MFAQARLSQILAPVLALTTLYLVWNTVRGRDLFSPKKPLSMVSRVIYGFAAAVLLLFLTYGWAMAAR